MVTAFKYLLGGKLKKADEAPTREEQLLVDIRALKKEMTRHIYGLNTARTTTRSRPQYMSSNRSSAATTDS